jgi:hypothetical protein
MSGHLSAASRTPSPSRSPPPLRPLAPEDEDEDDDDGDELAGALFDGVAGWFEDWGHAIQPVASTT